MTQLATLPSFPDLADKVAVVTGGAGAIGAATARALAANGARVAVVGRTPAALNGVTDSITVLGGRAIAVAADCNVDADLQRLLATVTDQLGSADVIFTFAGGNGMPVPTVEENGPHWRAVIDSDLTTTFLTVAAFLPAMLARRHGVIVTMASAAARQPAQSSAAYAAAKAGVIAFTRHIANELAEHDIRANCLAPSTVENDRIRRWVPEEQRAVLAASFPLSRLGQPDDVAAAALFLASDASLWITGVTLDIAGGKIMI